jgi:hypothetical protein
MLNADRNESRPMVAAPLVCKQFGITPRTRQRWELDPEMGFPRPSVINKRKYFYVDEIEEFKIRRRLLAEMNPVVVDAIAPETKPDESRSDKNARQIAAGRANLERGRKRKNQAA